MIQQKDLTLISSYLAISKYTTKKTINIQLGGSKSLITADVLESNKKINTSILKLNAEVKQPIYKMASPKIGPAMIGGKIIIIKNNNNFENVNKVNTGAVLQENNLVGFTFHREGQNVK